MRTWWPTAASLRNRARLERPRPFDSAGLCRGWPTATPRWWLSAAARPGSRRRLNEAGIACLIVEARPRLGGRAWTIDDGAAFPIDLGCGWLHSADRNPWREIAEAQGCAIDRTPPPWTRISAPIGFPLSEQASFLAALEQFPSAARRARRGCAGCSRGDLARAARPLERLDQRGRHLRERLAARARVDEGFQPLPRQRRELAGGRGTAARGPPMASWSS